MSSLTQMTEEQRSTFEQFAQRISEVAQEVFGEAGATIILGAQWGDMGQAGQPICALTSNLPVCALSAAIGDMSAEAEMLHRAAHGLPETEEADDFTERVALADAPEEVQQIARGLMEQYGVTEDQLVITNHVDTSDLASLPVSDEPQPGDPTTVEGTD